MSRYFTINLLPQFGSELGKYTAKVTYHGTTTVVPLFQDEALSVSITNPITQTVPTIKFWVDDGTIEYDIILDGNNFVQQNVLENIWQLPGPIWSGVKSLWSQTYSPWMWLYPYIIKVKNTYNANLLPTSPTVRQETVPSYLYFQYANDEDLQALVNAYNSLTQVTIDWFNSFDIPYYPGLSGTFEVDGITYSYLDWVLEGVYGYVRPNLASIVVYPLVGPTATYRTAQHPTAGVYRKTTENYLGCPDDIYKRCLTWNFYKGDGFVFSIEWLKRRIYRFLYGANGTDIFMGYTPNVSVQFQNWIDTTSVEHIGPTASYETAEHKTSYYHETSHSISTSFKQTIIIRISNMDQTIVDYFASAIENGYLYIPLEFQVTVNP